LNWIFIYFHIILVDFISAFSSAQRLGRGMFFTNVNMGQKGRTFREASSGTAPAWR